MSAPWPLEARPRRLLVALGLLALIAVVVVTLAWPSPGPVSSGAAGSINGVWNLTFEGDVSGPCIASLEQSDSSLTFDPKACPIAFSSLTGTIDAAGVFSVSSGGAALAGTASANSLSGTWIFAGLSGTFSGERKVGIEPPPPAIDVGGVWNLTFEGDVSGPCTASLEQSDSSLTFDPKACPIAFSTLTGTIDAAGVFSVSSGGAALAGTASADGCSLSGTWIFAGLSGTFTGTRKGCPTQTPTPTNTPTPTPTKQPNGDTDNDGCLDTRENGLDETLGGRRDYLDFWDFFDPNRDRSVTLLDFLAILRHFNTVGDPSTLDKDGPEPPAGEYWASADRGGQAPDGDPWDELPANGSIGLGDFLSVLRQFGHTCA